MNYKDATPEDIIRMKIENVANERIPLQEINGFVDLEELEDGKYRLYCNRCGNMQIVNGALYSFDYLQQYAREHRNCRKE